MKQKEIVNTSLENVDERAGAICIMSITLAKYRDALGPQFVLNWLILAFIALCFAIVKVCEGSGPNFAGPVCLSLIATFVLLMLLPLLHKGSFDLSK